MAEIDAIFQMVKRQGASDLHIVAGSPPVLRIHGSLSPIDAPPLTAEQARRLLYEMMTEQQIQEFEERRDLDFAYEVPGEVRLRCNVFEQMHGIAGAFRLLPSQIYTIEQLRLPAQVKRFADLKKGLVVVTGPPGSGKSTSQAAIIDHINRNQSRHILTIEDPIEYVHKNIKCLVNQREIGRSARSFAQALRAALREDPDIILVGEMRDNETMQLAITAAETGQVVFGTLHTAGAAQTIDRIIDAFQADKQQQIRTMLSESLQGVVSQRLIPRADGEGRVAAVEVLVATMAIRSLIRERKTFLIPSQMQTGRRDGMQLMDNAIIDLLREGLINPEAANLHATSKEAVAPFLRSRESPTGGAPPISEEVTVKGGS